MVSTIIRITGIGAFIAIVLFLMLQMHAQSADPILRYISFGAFIILAGASVIDALRGGLSD